MKQGDFAIAADNCPDGYQYYLFEVVGPSKVCSRDGKLNLLPAYMLKVDYVAPPGVPKLGAPVGGTVCLREDLVVHYL